MPGIVGLVTKMPREWAEPQLNRMVQLLGHESFYVVGTWIDESAGIYVGWSARKDSFADGMPVCNERGDVVMLFAGEEYTDAETIEPQNGDGRRPKYSRASYLVREYEEDSSFPAGLNGRFHGLVVDRRQGTATLFNDRYGMHRIYYHESKEAFYFAGEAKSLLAVRPELRKINARGLGEFVSCGSVFENRTLFENVFLLPPASCWSFRSGALDRKSSYFDPREWEDQGSLDPETFYQQFQQCFARSLPRYFGGHEKIGLSLTGGLDTRMIMAWQKSPGGSLPCYSFGGPYRDCQDVLLARRLASMYGQTHQVIPVGAEFLSRFSSYAERTIYLSDGSTDVSRAADLFANEKAREIAPVRMTGNYGSEVLRWAPAFKPGNPTSGLFQADFLQYIDTARTTYGTLVQGHPISFAVFRQAPWHHYGLLALEQTQVSVRSPYLDNDFVKMAFRAPKPAFARRDTANIDLCLRLIADGNDTFRRIRTDRGLGGHDNILAAMNRQWLEFTFKAEYAYDYGMPQWLARIDHTFSVLHFEKLFLGRHKFAHYRIWYRDALAAYVREMLLDSRSLSRPYLERKGVEQIVKGHLTGGSNYTTAIHKLLTLEILHRQFVD